MEWVSGNIYIRPNSLEKAGNKVCGHKHNFDHTTIIFKGRVHVKATLPDGQVLDRSFGDGCEFRHFLVKADVSHEITAEVDDTEFWCVYSHRTPQGDIVQEYTGWQEATI
jgi:hypothetical protein